MLFIILIYILLASLVSYIFSSKKGIPFLLLMKALVLLPIAVGVLILLVSIAVR